MVNTEMTTIKIHNFGVIKDIEIDLKQFNLLIGEQATGKSTICKVVYFFRCFKDISFNTAMDFISKVRKEQLNELVHGNYETNSKLFKEYINIFENKLKVLFINLFDNSVMENADLKLSYLFSNNIIEIYVDSNKHLKFKYNNILEEFLKSFIQKGLFIVRDIPEDLKNNKKSLIKLLDNIGIRFFIDEKMKNSFYKYFGDKQSTYYIPAGRSMLSLLTNQKTRLNYDKLEFINRKFMQIIEDYQQYFTSGIGLASKKSIVTNNSFLVAHLANNIKKGLRGDYKYENGNELFYPKNSSFPIPINHISSGQQEALWLYNLLYILILNKEKAFVIIEEPEAHLYPTLQKQIMEFIAQFINLTGSSVIITTHSPYILTATNNLSYAGKLREQNKIKKNKVDELLGKYNNLRPDSINAIKLLTNNEQSCENLIDKETGEFLAEKIDEVSNEINEQYTSLFEIEEE